MKRRSTTATETAATAQAAGATPVVSDRGTLRRGLQLAPEMTRGLGWTLLLALVATTSNVIVPMTIQRAIDDGILAPGGIDLGVVRWTCALAVVGVVLLAGVGLALLSVPLAVVAYFVLPTLYSTAALMVPALRDLGAWVNMTAASTPLMGGVDLTATEWAQLGTSSLLWIGLPLLIGIWRVLTREVK